ncbi:hypothetical protein E4P39_12920 [Blastococcus sp. CT_GayMR19]|uniref:hypothetical protein n=1 Tax=Blastococcus sp. CT_GayMR19 TaxID=2559608 RepID=UPI0010741574|nr:hypothetical protein [Blastococcus sp. CT_GayMR19]TFV74387.1 hypothetical protein E4P39_12920 [Blastococcus sp. CT_GayMR19]
MRPDLAELLDALRRSRRPRLLRLIEEAGLDAGPPAPEPVVVEPYRWFLARLGDGVKLTGAGHLPPALVADIMRSLGWDADWPGTNTREHLTVPVAELRDMARRLGLVRVHRGRLLPTTMGNGDSPTTRSACGVTWRRACLWREMTPTASRVCSGCSRSPPVATTPRTSWPTA